MYFPYISMTVAQLFVITNEKIKEILLAFHGREFG